MSRAVPFLPTSAEEMKRLNWEELDILLITGDCYVDHPSFGAAIIGRLLEHHGYKVGIIAQPDWSNPESLKVMDVPVSVSVSPAETWIPWSTSTPSADANAERICSAKTVFPGNARRTRLWFTLSWQNRHSPEFPL